MKWEVLSLDLKILCKMFDLEKAKEKVWFAKITRKLKGEASKVTIAKTLDKMLDLGIIDGQWEKVGNKWTRVLRITGEAKDFVRSVHRSIKEGSE